MKKIVILAVLLAGALAALSAQDERRSLILGTWASENYDTDPYGTCVLEFMEGGRVIAHSYSFLGKSNNYWERNEVFRNSRGEGSYSFSGSSLNITLRIQGFQTVSFSGPCRLQNGNYEFELRNAYQEPKGLFCGNLSNYIPNDRYYTVFRRQD
jgi:hypothetical protein